MKSCDIYGTWPHLKHAVEEAAVAIILLFHMGCSISVLGDSAQWTPYVCSCGQCIGKVPGRSAVPSQTSSLGSSGVSAAQTLMQYCGFENKGSDQFTEI